MPWSIFDSVSLKSYFMKTRNMIKTATVLERILPKQVQPYHLTYNDHNKTCHLLEFPCKQACLTMNLCTKFGINFQSCMAAHVFTTFELATYFQLP